MVFQDDGLDLARQVELGHLVIVDGATEDVRGAVVVKIDEALDRADRRRRRREHADLGLGAALERGHRGEADCAGCRGLEELAPARSVSLRRPHTPRLEGPVVAAAVREAPARNSEWLHGGLLWLGRCTAKGPIPEHGLSSTKARRKSKDWA